MFRIQKNIEFYELCRGTGQFVSRSGVGVCRVLFVSWCDASFIITVIISEEDLLCFLLRLYENRILCNVIFMEKHVGTVRNRHKLKENDGEERGGYGVIFQFFGGN